MSIAIVEYACELVRDAEERGVMVRLFGGVAVTHLVPETMINRPAPRDLDIVCRTKDILGVDELLRAYGCKEDQKIRRLFGSQRRRYQNDETGVVIDLCLDQLYFARSIDVRPCLHERPISIPVSDLIVSKLQPRAMTEVDVIDVLNLIAVYEPSTIEDDMCFNAERVGALCARDWGLFRLVLENLELIMQDIAGRGLDGQKSKRISWRISDLQCRIRSHPKSFRWLVRSLAGPRIQYWDEVVEFEEEG